MTRQWPPSTTPATSPKPTELWPTLLRRFSSRKGLPGVAVTGRLYGSLLPGGAREGGGRGQASGDEQLGRATRALPSLARGQYYPWPYPAVS